MAFRNISIEENDYAEYEKILELLKAKTKMEKLKMPQAVKRAMTLLKESLESQGE